jgi:hypothetical protein
VVSTGGKFAYRDDQETPNTQSATYDFGNAQLVFEVRGLLTGGVDGIPMRESNAIGNLFFGSDGWMSVDLEGFAVYKGETRDLVMQQTRQEGRAWDTDPHMASFLRAMRSRKAGDLAAPLDVGVQAANLCHYANISYRVGRMLTLEPGGAIAGDAQASALLTRDYRTPYVVPKV